MGPRKKKKVGANKAVSTINKAGAPCMFCKSTEDDEEKFGKKFGNKQGVTIHYFCMLFASGLSQRGRTEKEGILGFLIQDIKKEASRGNRLKCAYCKQQSATIGCVQSNCRVGFHFGCGINAGCLSQFFGNFASYCYDHRPYQEVPADEKKRFRAKHTTCIICTCPVQASSQVDTLRTYCCKPNTWYHKDCMQRMANSYGLHHFKCPLCNNVDDFQQEMLNFGIYIPDRDAQWELEPNAFQELLERHSECNAPECLCPSGRTHDQENSPWEVALCDWCGHQGTHVQCSGLKNAGVEWVCHECNEIVSKSPAMKAKIQPKKPVCGRPLKTTIPTPENRAQKRKASLSDSPSNSAKRKRLSNTGELKENGDVSRRDSKKTQDKSKIKGGATRRSEGHDIRHYFLDATEGESSSASIGASTPCSSRHELNESTISAMRTLNKFLRRSDNPLTLSTRSSPRRKPSVTDTESYASDSSNPSSLSRAERARRRASTSDTERKQPPPDKLPRWLRIHLKDDIFTGKNLGAKNANRFADIKPMSQDDPPVEIPLEDRRPAWFRHTLGDDFITGRNLGKKLSAESPSIHLPPGLACRLQPIQADPRPSGRGNDSWSIPGDHPGAVTLGHGSNSSSQVDSDSETSAVTRQRNMPYPDFIEHLQIIGYKSKSSIIERLSLYQQYINGDFELLTFADIAIVEPSPMESEDSIPPTSPTPSLVSPNDGQDGQDLCDEPGPSSPPVAAGSSDRVSPTFAWPTEEQQIGTLPQDLDVESETLNRTAIFPIPAVEVKEEEVSDEDQAQQQPDPCHCTSTDSGRDTDHSMSQPEVPFIAQVKTEKDSDNNERTLTTEQTVRMETDSEQPTVVNDTMAMQTDDTLDEDHLSEPQHSTLPAQKPIELPNATTSNKAATETLQSDDELFLSPDEQQVIPSIAPSASQNSMTFSEGSTEPLPLTQQDDSQVVPAGDNTECSTEPLEESELQKDSLEPEKSTEADIKELDPETYPASEPDSADELFTDTDNVPAQSNPQQATPLKDDLVDEHVVSSQSTVGKESQNSHNENTVPGIEKSADIEELDPETYPMSEPDSADELFTDTDDVPAQSNPQQATPLKDDLVDEHVVSSQSTVGKESQNSHNESTIQETEKIADTSEAPFESANSPVSRCAKSPASEDMDIDQPPSPSIPPSPAPTLRATKTSEQSLVAHLQSSEDVRSENAEGTMETDNDSETTEIDNDNFETMDIDNNDCDSSAVNSQQSFVDLTTNSQQPSTLPSSSQVSVMEMPASDKPNESTEVVDLSESQDSNVTIPQTRVDKSQSPNAVLSLTIDAEPQPTAVVVEIDSPDEDEVSVVSVKTAQSSIPATMAAKTPSSRWQPRQPVSVIVDVEEIPTGQSAGSGALIDLTDDNSDAIILTAVRPRHRKQCCRTCGKTKRNAYKKPLNTVDQNTFLAKDLAQIPQVIELD